MKEIPSTSLRAIPNNTILLPALAGQVAVSIAAELVGQLDVPGFGGGPHDVGYLL